MVGWVVSGVGLALGIGFFATRARRVARLLSDEHFLEIARAAPGLKAAALQHADDADDEKAFSPQDPRVLVTSAGLVAVYTMRRREGQVTHHLSVSVRGGVTTGAVGMTFVVWLAMLVGLPVERVRLEVAPSTVHHGEAILTSSEHDDATHAPMPDVTKANVREFCKKCLEARSRLHIAR